jgi:hypothetical protein
MDLQLGKNLCKLLDKNEWHVHVWDSCENHFVNGQMCYCKRCQSYLLISLANYTGKRVEHIPKVSLKDKMKVRISVTYCVAIQGGSYAEKLQVVSLSELIDRLSHGTLHETSKRTDYAEFPSADGRERVDTREFLQRINGKIVTFLVK